jgi:hypothetical protein
LVFVPFLGQEIDPQEGEPFLTQKKVLFELPQPKREIMRINYANTGESNKSANGSAGAGALLFNAEYSTEMRKARIGLHPTSQGSLNARARVGVNFTSPITRGSSDTTIEIRGGIKGSMDNTLTNGYVEIVVVIKDLTANESHGKQIFFRDATKEKIDMPFNVTIDFLSIEKHEYFAYLEIRGLQDATSVITGKIDFCGKDYGVWYDEMIIWEFYTVTPPCTW